jgi:hypothetical protein
LLVEKEEVMSPAQEELAKKLRQIVMIEARKNGWSQEEAHEYFEEWGYGKSLRELTIDQLHEVKRLILRARDGKRDIPLKPTTPLDEITPNSSSAEGMATPKQVYYAGVLARRYAELRGISADDSFTAWHHFVSKYQKIDHIQFCTKNKATKVIAIMERAFITTFGNKEFHDLTGHTWQYRGKRYRKYGGTPEHPRNRKSNNQ